jgi:myo-inositol-1(or 4)-monophosphatase
MFKQTIIEASKAAEKILKQYYQTSFEISSKTSINDIVTIVDKESEAAIISIIKQNFPDHYIYSEEAGDLVQESNYKWIIDPIDGTVNFAHGLPMCGISIALAKDNEIILGAITAPFFNEFYLAEKNIGATMNDKPIAVSQQADIKRALVSTGFAYEWNVKGYNPMVPFTAMMERNIPVRRVGTAAINLCWIAAGRTDGYWEHNLHAYDTAAGFLMVTEAGGTVTNFEGQTYDPWQPRIVATNGKIHQEILDVLF